MNKSWSTTLCPLFMSLLCVLCGSSCPLCASAAQGAAEERASGPSLTRVEVKPNLYMVVGAGTNTAFLVTDAGVVVVGAKESEQAGRDLRDVIAGVTNKPVRYLILPNHQARCTHGSTLFPKATVIVAHERARRHMLQPPEADYWTGLAASSLPNLTLSDHITLYLGSTRVQVMHPGRGHTDGDLVVLFPDQHAVCTGDLFWNRRLPFVDQRHGGSAAALAASLQKVLALPEVDTYIPGYGDVGTRADLRTQVGLLRDLQLQVRQAIARHQTRSQAIQAIPIPTYAHSDPSERFNALVGAIYDDLSATRAPSPAVRVPGARAPTRIEHE